MRLPVTVIVLLSLVLLLGVGVYMFRRDVLYQGWSKFLTIFGDIMLSTSPPLTRAKHIRNAMEMVRPGDILCRRFDCYLDGYFIPGKYTHSGIMIDGTTMIDATAEGVQKKDLIDFIKDTDGFIILRPKYESEDQKNRVIAFSLSQIGTPYDFVFQDGNNAYYCHEFTATCLKEAGISVPRTGQVYLASDFQAICSRIYESDDPKFQFQKRSFFQSLFPVRYYPK